MCRDFAIDLYYNEGQSLYGKVGGSRIQQIIGGVACSYILSNVK